MSLRKILLGAVAGAVGIGAMLMSRGKDNTSGGGAGNRSHGWVRSTRLAENIDHPLGVAVDGESLYVVGGGFARAENAVRRVPIAGGPIEVVTTVSELVSGELAVDADSVYFTSEIGNVVLRVKKSGGQAETFAQAQAPTQLALDGTHVYFATFSKQEPGGTVQRVRKSGGTPEVLASGHPGIDSLVVDDSDVFFRSNKGLWKVPKNPTAGNAAVNLWPRSEKQNAGRVTADATHLYFFLETHTQGKYAVARMSKTGGAPETIGPVADPTGRLALSDTHVYFFRAATLTENILAKVQKSGGEPETVDGSGHSTGYLFVSMGNVYFTDIDSIYRVPK